MPKLRNGHAPGHVRETARDAFETWVDWNGTSPEPTVECENGYVPRSIPISKICGLVWNCTDIVRGALFHEVHGVLEFSGRTIKKRTYGACARAILKDIKHRTSST